MSKLQIQGVPVSNNVLTITLFAANQNIDQEEKMVDLMSGDHLKEEQLAINPQHQIPAIVDADGTKGQESNAILRYLACKQATAAQPEDLKERLRIDIALDKTNDVYKTWQAAGQALMGFAPMIEGETKAKEFKAVTDKLDDYFKNSVGERKFIGGDIPCIADFKLFPMLNILVLKAAVNFGQEASDRVKTQVSDFKATVSKAEEVLAAQNGQMATRESL